jgi:hypothetical protein
MLSESVTYVKSARMAKRQRLYALAAGPVILQAAVAAITKRFNAIAPKSPARCSNASTCMSKCRDCRRPNCGQMRRRANPATWCAHALCERAKSNDNVQVAATLILINRKRMRRAASRRTIRRCSKTRLICCSCPHVRCIAFCGWRERLPISRVARTFSVRMWRRRLDIGAGSVALLIKRREISILWQQDRNAQTKKELYMTT